MNSRLVGHSTLAVALGVMLAATATGSDQQAQDNELRERTARYVERLLEPTPNAQQTLDQLDEFVTNECTALQRAGIYDFLLVEKKEEWLRGLVRGAKARLGRASDLMRKHLTNLKTMLVGIMRAFHIPG